MEFVAYVGYDKLPVPDDDDIVYFQMAHLRHQQMYIAVIIDAKSSDVSTVYTTIKRCRDMISTLGQECSILQTMDQQLYAVAQQVKWTVGEQFAGHILRWGGGGGGFILWPLF